MIDKRLTKIREWLISEFDLTKKNVVVKKEMLEFIGIKDLVCDIRMRGDLFIYLYSRPDKKRYDRHIGNIDTLKNQLRDLLKAYGVKRVTNE